MLVFSNTSAIFSGISTSRLRIMLMWLRILNGRWSSQLCNYACTLINYILLPLERLMQAPPFNFNITERYAKMVGEQWSRKIYSTIDDSLYQQRAEHFTHCSRLILETVDAPHLPIITLNTKHLIEPRILRIVSERKMLNKNDSAKYNLFVQQVDQICQLAHRQNKMVIIAPPCHHALGAIYALSEDMMMAYNKTHATVYAPFYPCYTDCHAYLRSMHQKLHAHGITLGAMLVYGIIEPTDINSHELCNFAQHQESHRAFIDALKYLFASIDSISTICNSHNESNITYCLSLMESMLLTKGDRRVIFMQHHGLGRSISWALAKAGYNVVRTIPLGYAQHRLLYTIHNTRRFAATHDMNLHEIKLIKAELKRRQANKHTNE